MRKEKKERKKKGDWANKKCGWSLAVCTETWSNAFYNQVDRKELSLLWRALVPCTVVSWNRSLVPSHILTMQIYSTTQAGSETCV